MAAKSSVRLNPRHQEMVRSKIRASWIIQRLQKCIEGKIEMSPVQMTAATVLLRKSIPDLSATELTGGDGGPLEALIKVGFIQAKEPGGSGT